MAKKRTAPYTSTEKRVANLFEVPMILASGVVLLLFIIPIFYDLSPKMTYVLAGINVLVWLAFYVELAVKFTVSSNWKRTFKDNWFLCLIALAPSIIFLRSFALLRVVGVFRLIRLQSLLNHVRDKIRELIINIEYFLLATVLFVLVSAVVMWRIEQMHEGTITTLPTALWWAVITITTVGYGDVVPTTEAGKLFGAVVALLGSIIFTVFVARITVFFVKRSW